MSAMGVSYHISSTVGIHTYKSAMGVFYPMSSTVVYIILSLSKLLCNKVTWRA